MQTEEERAAEYAKAEMDRMLYGTGVVKLTKDSVKHVPLEEFNVPPTGDSDA